jgi:hypothetical protein
MPHRALDPSLMREALTRLDGKLDHPARLVIGGGGAMLLAYGHTLATQDVDAFATPGTKLSALEGPARQVAVELDIAPDWLNGHFVTFTSVLPKDYSVRLRQVFDGAHLTVDALGPEDLLVMKCFAGRNKDRPHARKLLAVANDLSIVDRQLELLQERRFPGAERAADWFDDLRDEEGA